MMIGGMKSSVTLLYLFLLGCRLFGNGLLCNAFSSNRLVSLDRGKGRTRNSSFLQEKVENKEETEEVKEKSPKSEPISLYELAEMEARASKRINDRLTTPYRLGKVITYGAWFFLISGYVLNALGYGYVRGENGITIGTLAEHNFQIEMTRSSREAMEKSVDAATRSQMEVDSATMKEQ